MVFIIELSSFSSELIYVLISKHSIPFNSLLLVEFSFKLNNKFALTSLKFLIVTN